MNFRPCHNFLGGGPGKVAKSTILMIDAVWAKRNSSPTFQELRGAAPGFRVLGFLGFLGFYKIRILIFYVFYNHFIFAAVSLSSLVWSR